ncbi:MAG: serine hydrolase [Anaerolineae bacterium]|nr:class A beta-lactamase-related serine hydrolase [Candidatus Roseilinea sp.]MDW8449461.1 serine hydrolase [Anaerolineae bacterium]
MRRRFLNRSTLENAIVVSVIFIFAILVANVIAFIGSRNRLPPETRLGDLDVSGLTVDEAISAAVRSLQQPVTLRYLDQRMELAPDAIGFRLNEPVARLRLESILAGQQGLDKLPAFILRRNEDPARIPLPYQYSEPQLQSVLAELAARYNREARPPAPDLASGTVTPGQDGAVLNLAEASQAILAAMQSSISRTVDLPVDIMPLGMRGVRSLESAVLERLRPFTERPGNLAGVFIKDLRSGEELAINGDVAFSGAGWLKLGLILEAYRANELPIAPALREKLEVVSARGGPAEINDVLRALGDGDAQLGADRVNATLQKLGLRNTFLAQPLGQSITPPAIVTPANARGDINADPDPNAQSTVADVGVLLEMIEQCRNGAGGMILAFDGAFSAAKCDEMLAVIAKNGFSGLIEAGSGGAVVFHRQAWDERNHGDAALVRSPKGDYVVAVMLHGQGQLDWAETSPIISDIARLAYGFFNEQMPPAPPSLTGAPPP